MQDRCQSRAINAYQFGKPRVGRGRCCAGAVLFAAVAVWSAVVGTPVHAAEPPKTPYRVTTTTGMITDVVREVAGPRAEVTGIIGEGVDPHLYKPTRSDVVKLMQADLVFYNGLHLEGKMTDTLEKIAHRKPVIAVTQRLKQADLLTKADGGGAPDPHVWMDVRAWRDAVGVVADELAKFDPPGAATYRANAERLQAELAELDAYVRRVVGSIPERQRVLVTAHDAFSYFGRAYGIRVEGIQGLSTESEAGVRRINELVHMLVTQKIPAVFVETSVSEKNVRALVEGARAARHEVTIGGTLFSDAMGAPGTYEGTYIGMLDHNATTIARALGGDAPERGMNGKLAEPPR